MALMESMQERVVFVSGSNLTVIAEPTMYLFRLEPLAYASRTDTSQWLRIKGRKEARSP